MNTLRDRYRFFYVALTGLALLTGCERSDGIASYTVPKVPQQATTADPTEAATTPTDGTVPTTSPSLPAGHPPVASNTGQSPFVMSPEAIAAVNNDGPQWTVPANWKPLPNGMMDTARFAATSDTPPLPVTVSQAGGGMVANINRWEGQLQLPPTAEADIGKVIHAGTVNGAAVLNVDLSTPADSPEKKRMLAAIFPAGKMSWFVKMTGPADQVAAQKQNFDAFVQSFRFDAATAAPAAVAPAPLAPPHPMAASVPAVLATPADAAVPPPDSFTYTLAPGWTLKPSPTGGMIKREATFGAGTGNDAVDVTVIRMGPQFDLLSNINRWRGQVGLPPATDTSDAKDLAFAAAKGLLVDVTGPAPAGGKAQEMVVGVTGDGQSMWFFKMQGAAESVTKQRAAFVTFLGTVKLKP